MSVQLSTFIVNSIFLLLTSVTRAQVDIDTKVEEATSSSKVTYWAFNEMFELCVTSHIGSKQFKIDNIKSFVNFPSRTTVGTAQKLTSNRKFLANIISTRAFKEMLNKDAEAVWKNLVTKMKYCDNIVMNQNLLKDFYDREVDQTKL